ncbi:MAG: hypothetical protein OXP11_15075 [Gammaproteobacteria bacterium]|nr:hypothetical protein [Gammaproteobacteria bacterium]
MSRIRFSRATVHRRSVEEIAIERTQGGVASTRAEVCVDVSETVHAVRLLVELPDVETETRAGASVARDWPRVASAPAVSYTAVQGTAMRDEDSFGAWQAGCHTSAR